MSVHASGHAFGVVLLAVWVTLVASCATSPARSSRTAGLSLELFIQTSDRSMTFYRVRLDGTLGWAGGFDASREAVSWTGEMTDEEITTLRTLLERHGWLESQPPASEPGETLHRVKVRWSGGRESYEFRGGGPDVEPIVSHLDAIARRRHEEYLRTLPRPGPQN